MTLARPHLTSGGRGIDTPILHQLFRPRALAHWESLFPRRKATAPLTLQGKHPFLCTWRMLTVSTHTYLHRPLTLIARSCWCEQITVRDRTKSVNHGHPSTERNRSKNNPAWWRLREASVSIPTATAYARLYFVMECAHKWPTPFQSPNFQDLAFCLQWPGQHRTSK
jgi:hypothetical protein